MPAINFYTRNKVVILNGAAAAGTGTITPANGVDCSGFDSVFLLAVFGAVSATSVTGLQAQASNDNAVADPYSAIGGSNVVVPVAAGPLAVAIDVHRPIKRWVLPVVTRVTANAVLDCIVAFLYNAHGAVPGIPVGLDATVAAINFLADSSPLGAA
jgi:hypothetical protein